MPTRPRPSAAAAFTNAAHEYYLEQHATSEVGHRLNVSCQLCVLPRFISLLNIDIIVIAQQQDPRRSRNVIIWSGSQRSEWMTR